MSSRGPMLQENDAAVRGDDLRPARRKRVGTLGTVEAEDGDPGGFHELQGEGDLLAIGGEGGC